MISCSSQWVYQIMAIGFIGFGWLAVPAGVLAFFAYEAHLFIPAIARAYDYVPARMTVRQISLVAGHCCRLDCFCNEVGDSSVESCSPMESRAQALSPAACASASPANASSLCPPTGSAAVCSNGPFCCTSCDYSCSTPSPPSCLCPCSSCAPCSCCKHLQARICRLFCAPCYNASMAVAFTDRHGAPRAAIFRHSAGSNQAAKDFFSDFKPNSTFLGFYKPSDPIIVHFSRGYRVRKWAAFIMLSALPLMLAAILITSCLIYRILVAMAIPRPMRTKTLFWANWVLWLGVIWPFLILLLILKLAYPTPRAKAALNAIIPLMAFIGWMPALVHWFSNK